MIRTRLRLSAAVLLVATAVLLAGCGGSGGPHLTHQDAAPLIALADRISREAPCAQARDIRALTALRTKLVNERKVPSELQDPLSSGVNALAALTPPCVPAVPVRSPPPTIVPKHGKGPKHDHHGKDKGGK